MKNPGGTEEVNNKKTEGRITKHGINKVKSFEVFAAV
jgi:hypothetical protein